MRQWNTRYYLHYLVCAASAAAAAHESASAHTPASACCPAYDERRSIDGDDDLQNNGSDVRGGCALHTYACMHVYMLIIGCIRLFVRLLNALINFIRQHDVHCEYCHGWAGVCQAA